MSLWYLHLNTFDGTENEAGTNLVKSGCSTLSYGHGPFPPAVGNVPGQVGQPVHDGLTEGPSIVSTMPDLDIQVCRRQPKDLMHAFSRKISSRFLFAL